MTAIQDTATANTTRNNLLIRLWSALLEKKFSGFLARQIKRNARPRTALPNSGMPISHDVATKLSIRAGFTAGPW